MANYGGLVPFAELLREKLGFRETLAEQLSHDTTVQRLLGLDGPIDKNTLAYRLKKAGYRQSVEMSRVSRALAARVQADITHIFLKNICKALPIY